MFKQGGSYSKSCNTVAILLARLGTCFCVSPAALSQILEAVYGKVNFKGQNNKRELRPTTPGVLNGFWTSQFQERSPEKSLKPDVSSRVGLNEVSETNWTAIYLATYVLISVKVINTETRMVRDIAPFLIPLLYNPWVSTTLNTLWSPLYQDYLNDFHVYVVTTLILLLSQDYLDDFKSQDGPLTQESSYHGDTERNRPILDYNHPAYQLY